MPRPRKEKFKRDAICPVTGAHFTKRRRLEVYHPSIRNRTVSYTGWKELTEMFPDSEKARERFAYYQKRSKEATKIRNAKDWKGKYRRNAIANAQRRCWRTGKREGQRKYGNVHGRKRKTVLHRRHFCNYCGDFIRRGEDYHAARMNDNIRIVACLKKVCSDLLDRGHLPLLNARKKYGKRTKKKREIVS